MPTYSLRNIEPVEDIIKAQGRFGPDLRFSASCIFEAINVFGGVEWPLFMLATPAQATRQLEDNPFYTDFKPIWAAESPDEVAELGSVAAIIVARNACRAILRAKFGQSSNEHIARVEDQYGTTYWHTHFWTGKGVDRLALLDEYEGGVT